jgi:succinoglycan biosynthesis transport protein ExoP
MAKDHMVKYEETTLDLRDYLSAVQKHRWMVASIFTTIFVSAVIYAVTALPVYEAVVRLVIEKENPNVVSIEEVLAIDASANDYYQTQCLIITSRIIARKVIEHLRLDQHNEFRPQRDQVSEATKVNSQLVNFFIDRITVKPIPGSRLVDIKFQANDPVLAAEIANHLADTYIQQTLEIRLGAIQDAVKWLQNRVKEERGRVEKAEQALHQYKAKHHIITDFSNDSEKITAQKLAQLNAQVVELQSKRVEAETRYKQAQAMAENPDMLDSIPEVLNNELIRKIKSMEVELYQQISELSKKYGRKHPRMVAMRSELDTLKRRKTKEISQVIDALKNEYQVTLAKEKTLVEALSAQKQASLSLNQKAIAFGALKRENESTHQMYELLIKRFKETSLTENIHTGNIRIIDRAEVPLEPVKPWRKLIVFLAAVIGLLSGTVLATFIEYLDDTIQLPDDIKKHLNIPYLGHIPSMDIGDTPKGNPALLTYHAPKSIVSEAYRVIRTAVLFSSIETEIKTILITSVGPKEGKTRHGFKHSCHNGPVRRESHPAGLRFAASGYQ